MLIAIIQLVAGFLLLVWGADRLVAGASAFARNLGVSPLIIGLTIIGFGTSAPELVVSAVATLKGNPGLAVGNAIGSNIFNLLWILGLSAVIKPLEFSVINNSDIMMIILASTLLIMAVVIGKKPVISRWEGGYFLLAYVLYMIFLVSRG